jgi:hypothetical protein
MGFQSVEMVLMRLSTASLHLLRFSLLDWRLNLTTAAMTMDMMRRRGITTAAATLPPEVCLSVKGPLFTTVMAPSGLEVSALAGTPEDGVE